MFLVIYKLEINWSKWNPTESHLFEILLIVISITSCKDHFHSFLLLLKALLKNILCRTMAFHLDHPKLAIETPTLTFERANTILNAWSEEHPCMTRSQILQMVALLDPCKLVARGIRHPFRTSCTYSKLRWLFYYHASRILGFSTQDVARFPRELNNLVKELWPGDGLIATMQCHKALCSEDEMDEPELPNTRLPLKKRGGCKEI